MHQSHFSSWNDLLWAGSLFCNKGIWNSDHVCTHSHMRRGKRERQSLRGPENAKICSSLWKKVRMFDLSALPPPTLTDLLAERGRFALGQSLRTLWILPVHQPRTGALPLQLPSFTMRLYHTREPRIHRGKQTKWSRTSRGPAAE